MDAAAELFVLKNKFERLSAGPVLFRQVVMECPDSWHSISLVDMPLPPDFALCSHISKSIWEPGQPQFHPGWKFCDVIGSEIRDPQTKAWSGTFEQIAQRLSGESAPATTTFWDLYQRCCELLQQHPDTVWSGVPRLPGSRRITAEILHRVRPRLLWYLHPERYRHKDPRRNSRQRWVPAPADMWEMEECRVWIIDDFAADAALVIDMLTARASGEEPEVPKAVIVLDGPGKPITVKGNEKAALTDPQYHVIQALLEAGSPGLNKDQLVKKSGHGDAVRILKRIARIDGDWQEVIGLAGKPGGRYRVLDLH